MSDHLSGILKTHKRCMGGASRDAVGDSLGSHLREGRYGTKDGTDYDLWRF